MSLPNGWEVKSLGDVSEIITGNTPSKSDNENFNGKYKWVKPSDLSGETFIIKKTEETLSEKGIKKMRLLPKGAVLVTCIGNLGKIGLADEELFTNQQINSIVFDNTIYPKYGFFYCKTIKNELDKLSSSTTISIVNKSNFSKINIIFPTIKEQKKIASILERADNLRKKRKEANKLFDELLQSIFLEIFGNPFQNEKKFPFKELKEISNISRGRFSPRPRNDPQYYGGSIPFIQTGDVVKSNTYINFHNQTLNEKGLKVSKLFKKGTIAITIAANIGETAILGYDMCFPDSLIGIIPNENFIISEYIETHLRFYKNKLNSEATETAQKNVNLENIKPLLIMCPPIELQNKFAQIVEKIESLKEKAKESEKEIEDLFNSLMQNAFSGQLDLTGYEVIEKELISV